MNSVVCITSAGILWGIIAIFISLLKDLGFNSLQCVAIRVFFSALCLVIYLSIFDRSKLKIEFKDIIYFLGTGILSIIFFNYWSERGRGQTVSRNTCGVRTAFRT